MTLKLPGFTSSPIEVPRQLVICVNAKQRRGKSHFSLKTVPGPVVFLPTETGFTPVLARIQQKRSDIQRPAKPFIFDPTRYRSEGEFKLKAREMWFALRAAFREATQPGSGVGTCVLDTGSAAWNLCKFAYEGKSMPRDYGHSRGLANADWQSMVQAAQLGSTHVIITHRVKAVWGDQAPTGEWELIGHQQIEFDTMLTITLDTDREGRVATISNCRHNPKLDGEELRGKDCSFAGLYRTVFGEEMGE